MILGSLIALGQWGDTKEVLADVYVTVKSEFTHEYEYQQLAKVNVGNNINYVEQFFGAPQFVKASKYEDTLKFYYYFNDKFLLTLVGKENRVMGYTITSLEDDFVPLDLLNKETSIAGQALNGKTAKIDDYTLDYNNVDYLLIREQQGRENLYINKYFGSIGYDGISALNKTEVKSIYDALEMDVEDPAQINDRLAKLMAKTQTNLYGVGELELSVIADSVLTEFEFLLYTKSH
ncbi:ETEC_3214 domain-containing protein [Thalassotalea maritima]|uniref:ETEC_3214 domain-containing protein n=1 Tax=Thalassotalea maritima TaxID=3242416 RepID=UPI003527066F